MNPNDFGKEKQAMIRWIHRPLCETLPQKGLRKANFPRQQNLGILAKSKEIQEITRRNPEALLFHGFNDPKAKLSFSSRTWEVVQQPVDNTSGNLTASDDVHLNPPVELW